jgi:hypothetical protein
MRTPESAKVSELAFTSRYFKLSQNADKTGSVREVSGSVQMGIRRTRTEIREACCQKCTN